MIKFLGFGVTRVPGLKKPKANKYASKKSTPLKYKKKAKKAPKKNFELKDKTRNFSDFLERMAGHKSMLKDHTATQFQKNSTIKQKIETIRMDREPHNTPLGDLILVKVVNKILTELGSPPKPTKITRKEGVPNQIYKSQDGVQFRTKFTIEHGEPNRYLKSANKEYGKTSTWLPCLGTSMEEHSLYTAARIWSQTGANRQGIMTGGLLDKTSRTLTGYNSTEVYNYFGLPSHGMMADYFAREGLSTDQRSRINKANFTRDYNIDMFTNINSRYSVHEFFNANTYMDANIKVYVCSCAALRLDYNIWSDVANFGNGQTPTVNRIPEVGVSTGAILGGNKQWWAEGSETITLPDYTQSAPKFLEFSTVLGVTPQQSQTFKDHWDVLDVIDCTIGPQDTWTLNLAENFSKSFSVKEWQAAFTDITFATNAYNTNNKKQTPGDIVLFTVFSGEPTSTFQLDGQEPTPPATEKVYPAPIALDAAPCAIRHTVRHGMSTSWPSTVQQTSEAADQPMNTNEAKGFVSFKQKTNFTERETWEYKVGTVEVMTNKSQKSGGLRGEL